MPRREATRPRSVRGLLDGCADNDPAAWDEFWGLVGGPARWAVWKTLLFFGADPSLADDLGQEVFLHFRADGGARLRRFRGATEEELRAFVRVAAARMAFQRLRRWRNAYSREAVAARAAASSSHSGPTPAQIDLAFRDLEGAMTGDDRARLRRLRDWNASPGSAPCPRALRRLRGDLVRRYAARVV